MLSDFEVIGRHYRRALKMNELEFQMEIQSKINWLIERAILPAGKYYANIAQSEHELVQNENGETYTLEICFTIKDLKELNYPLVAKILNGLVQEYQYQIREDQFDYTYIDLRLIPSVSISEELAKDVEVCDFTALAIIENQLRFPKYYECEEEAIIGSTKRLLSSIYLSKEECPELYGYACNILFALITNEQFEMARMIVERGIKVNEKLLTLYGREKDSSLLEELTAINVNFVKRHFNSLASLGIARDTLEHHMKNLKENMELPF